MKSKIVIMSGVALFSVLVATCDVASAQSYNYQILSIPGANLTARDINNSGVVVGAYNSGSRAFSYDNGVYADIRVPGSSGTIARGINDKGDIVGRYQNSGSHGYIYSGGKFTTNIGPDGSNSVATGINDNGVVVGDYAGGTRGFEYQNGLYSLIDVPDATSTFVSQINDTGDVVGYYTNSLGAGMGFLSHNGVFSDISVPGSASSGVLGINNNGEMVGFYTQTSGGPELPFVKIGNIYSLLNVPGQTFPGQLMVTDATGVNDSGTVVGYSGLADGSVLSTFIATPVLGAQVDLLLQGGSQSAPQVLPLSLVGSITSSIGGAGGLTSEFYSFDWLGGQFESDLSVVGASSGTYYDFELCSGAVCGPILANTTLDHSNNWLNSISLSSLTAGQYTIGLVEHDGGPDPWFTLSFKSAVGSPVPEPSSWALMLLGFGTLGAALRRRRMGLATA